jgi:hypothetical protein
MFEKKHIFLLGIITLGVLIYVNSNKKLELEMVEVEEPKDDMSNMKKSFDSSTLPLTLMPPTRLGDGEPLPPNTIKKNFSNVFNLKPRFDRKSNNFL